jgi:hypothetical protein
MKLRSLLALLSIGSLVTTASAQYLGSNDFSSSTGGVGQYSITANAGTFTVEQGRLEYSAGLTASTRVLNMNGAANTAYTEDWTASLTLTNLAAPASGYNLVSMQVFSANAEYGFFNIGLYRTATGTSGVLFEKGRTTDGTVNTYAFTSYIAAESDFSDVLVRMSHNSTTKDITLGYSLDAGATYLDAVTFNPNLTGSAVSAGNWYGTPTDGYSFRILGRNSVDTIAGDLMYADDFSVVAGAAAISAIPEPSTYAALAGLGALGLALWRRRAKAC